MPIGPAVVIGGLALVLMMAGGKKKKPKRRPPEPLPEPKPEEKTEPPPSEKNEAILAVLEDYVIPDGYDFPAEIPTEAWPTALWISEDCKAFALGADYKNAVTQEVLDFYTDTLETVSGTEDDWLIGMHPDYWGQLLYESGSTVFESPPKRFVIQLLFDLGGGAYVKCAERMPLIQDYETPEGYLAAWGELREEDPALYKLFYHVYSHARDTMEAAWEEQYPDAAQEWVEREWAGEAAEQDLNLEDKADWAFHHAYPDGPEVLDPENPDHEPYIDAWVRLKGYIQEVMG